MMINNSDRNGV